MSAYFVTATGTDIGKTYVTAGILRATKAAGRPACAIKPLLSGYDPAVPETSDSTILLAAMGLAPTAENIAVITPWRYIAALAPDMAAAREGKEVSFAAVTAFCEAAINAAPGLLLIEGAGGVLAPLTAGQTNRSLILALGAPAILVAGTYLGTISHTLASAEALATRGIRLAVIVLSESVSSPIPPEETAAAIRRFLPMTPIKIIPRNVNEASFADLAAFLADESRVF
jgi:dethiobiotin synthetase